MNTTDLTEVESRTLTHYDDNARAFFAGTIDHDVSQNYAEFLAPFRSGQRLDILDFGCGPGRDLKYFRELGHTAVGLDGSIEFCKMARQYSACEVLHQSFLNLSLPPRAFDGIFANASLFHVPGSQLPGVLNTLHDTLRSGGILFMSNPRGNSEGWYGERYGCYMEIDVIEQYLRTAGFAVLRHYYRPAGLPREQQPWLAVVSQCRISAEDRIPARIA